MPAGPSAPTRTASGRPASRSSVSVGQARRGPAALALEEVVVGRDEERSQPRTVADELAAAGLAIAQLAPAVARHARNQLLVRGAQIQQIELVVDRDLRRRKAARVAEGRVQHDVGADPALLGGERTPILRELRGPSGPSEAIEASGRGHVDAVARGPLQQRADDREAVALVVVEPGRLHRRREAPSVRGPVRHAGERRLPAIALGERDELLQDRNHSAQPRAT